MIIINLFGGPGTGKSTVAAGVFHLLKLRGVNCELVTEYAKDLTWEKNHCQLGNQLRIFAEQYHRLRRLVGQVDIAVTDAPLLVSNVYCEPELPASFNQLVADTHGQFDNMNFFLGRAKPYQPIGRNHTEEQAQALDKHIRGMLSAYDVEFWDVPCDHAAAHAIAGMAGSRVR